MATSRPLGCRHILVRHAVLLWPGLSKRLPAPGWWGGDPTVATLPRDPGASRKTKTEVQSDSPRGFREVPPHTHTMLPFHLIPRTRTSLLVTDAGTSQMHLAKKAGRVEVSSRTCVHPHRRETRGSGSVWHGCGGPAAQRWGVSRGEGYTRHTAAAAYILTS